MNVEPDWVSELYSFLSKGDRESSVDLLMDRMDDLFYAGCFEEANEILQKLDLARLDPTLWVCLLSITKATEEHLPHRASLVREIETLLVQIIPDRAENLLRGLR